MWLLLFISFGMTSCLLITLAVFDLLDPDRKIDEKDDSTIMVMPPLKQNTATEDTTTQAQSSTSSEAVTADIQL